jgi:uncharacterized membrane protein
MERPVVFNFSGELVTDPAHAHSGPMPATNNVVLDATLRPNPPLSPSVLRLIVVAVALVNVAFGLTLMLHGAWPVMPFMGADVALLAWAFRASSIAARRHERITLRPESLTVEHHPARGTPSRIELNPYWVRVHLEEPEEHWSRLTLRSHGRAVQVGSFLAPQDRQSFAEALKAALRKNRETAPPS